MDATQFDLATYPVKDTIKILTALLEKITLTNDQHLEANSFQSSTYTCFHARSIPSISIHAYFTRILKYCPCANECLIALLVYFDRMTLPNPDLHLKPLHIDSYNVHRLIITGLMISSKLYSDVFFTNTRYAKVGGLPVTELNTLELEFLKLNSYSLFVTIDELQKYGDSILHHWNHSQDTGPLIVKDITNTNDEIARPFSRLTMQNKCTPPDKHWRYSSSNGRQSFVKTNSGNGTADPGDALRRI
ncbi:cyclin-domain-containing protein [Mucor mucedo]|uniref:cyclin-domain-containing protein n=1 Tax=Mucor mucedo TaxID=29922 RepID=UPI002220317B|nr:cyclin-domain-containing protein [Mucor mucedo]KAI7893411.1 cyclin-domain-containing protein [Mucor mucedo]